MTVQASVAGHRGPGSGVRAVPVIAGGVGVLLLTLLAAVAVLGGVSVAGLAGLEPATPDVSARAARDIPAAYLSLYETAAQRYGLDWAILAGIGKVECDHGRDPDLACSREGAVNSAGAGGPMQFLAATWATYGIDGDGDGRADRWDPADAIYAAARYLKASGAPADYRGALLAYNHAGWYVADVERWAARYRSAGVSQGASPTAQSPAAIGAGEGADTSLARESPTLVSFTPGDRAQLAAGDGHLALIPAGAPSTVQAMVVAGNELQGLDYGPGGHPDPRGAAEEDCSSTLNYVLYRSGVRPIGEIVRDNPLAQDYVHWGASGPGRWVTIYATDAPTAHVFAVIAGLRLDTSHDGTDVGPNRNQDGPRWRILDHIPTWARWSVRHPPGL